MKLYVKIIKKDNERILRFLQRCYASAHTGWDYKFCETYYDEDCLKEQCDKRRRSFDDLMSIVKTYYPHVSKKHIAKQIEKLTRARAICGKVRLNFLYCPDADRWIMYENSGGDPQYYRYLYMNSYGKSFQRFNDVGKGERSLKDILELMGYTKEQYTL